MAGSRIATVPDLDQHQRQRGVRIGNRAWEGAHGLEWELPSPPPFHSWTEPPSDALIKRGAAH